MYFPGQYKLEPTPEPSDEEEDSSEEEEEAFGGGKKKKEEEDPAASEILDNFLSELDSLHIWPKNWWISEAKAMAEKAQADAMAMVQSKCVLQWMDRKTWEFT